MQSRTSSQRGFTLIELLVVITIIVIVSAVALPTVLTALSHRQVREAARILQAVLAGAHDAAIRNNAPSGIRLLPDPVFNALNISTGLLDSGAILAANRIIPIEPAPNYTEGFVTANYPEGVSYLQIPYPGDGGGYYPLDGLPQNVLFLQESTYNPYVYPAIPQPPTSWFWNIRVGDKVQINNAGSWYTVVGPMNVTAAMGNPELFVNVGPPGTQSPFAALYANGDLSVVYYPDFLLLVNGVDDNANGWTDEGWDNIDNNGNGQVDELAEWEAEVWTGPSLPNGINANNVPYIIRRRPAPGPNAREVALPTQVVVDLTTWKTTRERSRLPVNPYTGYVDILVNPDGSVVPVRFIRRRRRSVCRRRSSISGWRNGATWPAPARRPRRPRSYHCQRGWRRNCSMASSSKVRIVWSRSLRAPALLSPTRIRRSITRPRLRPGRLTIRIYRSRPLSRA